MPTFFLTQVTQKSGSRHITVLRVSLCFHGFLRVIISIFALFKLFLHFTSVLHQVLFLIESSKEVFKIYALKR